MEAVRGFLDWYLAPWRRIGRKDFGIALTLATLPGLFIMMFGWGGSAGHYLGPVLDLMDGQSDPMATMQGLWGGGTPIAPAFEVDWTGALNSALLLAMIPLCRMRLRDMGWFGWKEVVPVVVFHVSVAEALVQSLTGYDVVPLGMAWGLATFAGYSWMTFAKGKARGDVHERTDYGKALPENKRVDDEY